MTNTKKLLLKTVLTTLLILFVLPLIFKLLALIWDAIIYASKLYVKYIDFYFNDIELSTSIAAGILAFFIFILFCTFLVFSEYE